MKYFILFVVFLLGCTLENAPHPQKNTPQEPLNSHNLDALRDSVLTRIDLNYDEFDGLGVYKPKDVFEDQQTVYLQFDKVDDQPASGLAIMVHCFGAERGEVFTHDLKIDGEYDTFMPIAAKSATRRGAQFSHFTLDSVSVSHFEQIRRIIKAHEVKVKTVGSGWETVWTITDAQKQKLNDVLGLYAAMGGKIDNQFQYDPVSLKFSWE